MVSDGPDLKCNTGLTDEEEEKTPQNVLTFPNCQLFLFLPSLSSTSLEK